MPLYAYHCPTCGRDADEYKRIADRATGPECCGAAMAQKLTACMVQVPGGVDVGYRCTITGQPVTSMRQRQYIMDKHGMVDARDLKDTWKRKEAAHKAEAAEIKAAQDKIPDAVRRQAQVLVQNPPAGA